MAVVRRLVFVSNSNLIQSEVRLRSKTKEPGRIKDKAPHKEARPDDANIEIGVLCMEYHKHILAGLISGESGPFQNAASSVWGVNLVVEVAFKCFSSNLRCMVYEVGPYFLVQQ